MVLVERAANISGHFHRSLFRGITAINDIVNRVNIYYSAHSRPPCSHS